MNREERIYSVTMTGDELRLFSEFLEQKLYDYHKWYDIDDMLIGGNPTNHSFLERDGKLSEFDKTIIQGRGNFWAGQAAGNGARDGGEHIKDGLDNVSKGVKTGAMALGAGIAAAGIAGAYSRVKAAKIQAKKNKEAAEERYKTSESENKKKDKKKK